VIRNQRVFGKPILTTTHGGYTLFLGNNASFFDYLMSDKTDVPWSAKDLPIVLATVHVNEAAELDEDHSYMSAAWNAIEDNRRAFAWACFYRVSQLWSPLPNKLSADESTGRRLLRYAVAAWYCGVYLLAAVGVWRIWKSGPPLRGRPGGRQDVVVGNAVADGESAGGSVLPRSGGPLLRPRWVWGVLLCVVFTGVHTFYWSNLRMRAPLMPFVALVAGAAFCSRQGAAADRSPKRSRLALNRLFQRKEAKNAESQRGI
jgi:hypothetical protein